MSDKQPTESAVRAASVLYALDRDVKIGAKIIDRECHLPEIKEAMMEAKEALTIMNRLSEGDPQLKYIVLNHPDKSQKCVGDVLKAALAAIEKVKG